MPSLHLTADFSPITVTRSETANEASHMDKGNTTQTALEEILAQAYGMKPDEYLTPTIVPNRHNAIVGDCTPYLKGLCTLQRRYQIQIEPLIRERNGIEDAIGKTIGYGRIPFSLMVQAIDSTNARELAARMEALTIEISPKITMNNMLGGLITVEIMRMFPETIGKSNVGIDSMWRVFWRDARHEAHLQKQASAGAETGLEAEAEETDPTEDPPVTFQLTLPGPLIVT